MSDLYIAAVSLNKSPPIAIGGPPQLGGQDVRNRLAVITANLDAMLDSPDAVQATHYLLCGWLALGRWIGKAWPMRVLGPLDKLQAQRPDLMPLDYIDLSTADRQGLLTVNGQTYLATRAQCDKDWLFAAQCSRTQADVIALAKQANPNPTN